jgi:exopolysaccharide production protein ExoQ
LSISTAAPPDLSAAALRTRAAAGLWRACATVLALVPVAMVVAHRSSPLVIGICALLGLLALSLEQGWGAVPKTLAAGLRVPLGRVALLFLAWSVLSLSWSEFRGPSALALLEFWFPVACALVLAQILPARVPPWGVWVLAGTLALACAAILLELHTGLALRRALGMRSATFIFNRPVLTVLVVLFPVLAALRGRGPWGWAAGVGLAVLAVATIARSESGAAAFGAAVAGATALAAFAAPRVSARVAAVCVILFFVLAPVMGPIADRLIPSAVHARLSDSHSRDRIDIWLSFGAAIRERPWIGSGFGVSPRLGDSAVAAQVAPERRTLLAVGHPHNAAVQIWTELGAVGAVLAVVVLLLTLRALGRFGPPNFAPMLALAAAIAAVSLVGHGAWQGWWPAAIGTAVVWFRFALRLEKEAAR